MGFFSNLFATKEIKEVLSVLDTFRSDISQSFGKSLEASSVADKLYDECRKQVLSQSDKITESIRNGSVSARRVCLNAMKKNVEQNVVSGENHIYRGVLSDWGRVYFDFYKWVLLKFKEDGIITEGIMREEIRSVEDDVKEVG
ncbi:hypothetical protein E4631_23340 [Hymenobacter sp. UV11]|uniref:hypothetical protein n=1 Tax=Hymenobacter sp. UV11 TaxID=1849735 RepID=UPI00106008BE|nr:hypothetical protein [Hymenobacter sp. UV11]TDN39837.1 hypothetical protein A8B98_16735 [Hymenobacter sp. UV11]TFZ63241.1 hypothetical protein E4631_23340 [Hymenobacter sp. UV11]